LKKNNYCGIDIGNNGGVAVISQDGNFVDCQKLKCSNDKICKFLKKYSKNSYFFVEHVHSSPQMGVRSAFTFGQNFGFILGSLTSFGVGFELISPQKWQKKLNCLTKGNKNITKNLAQELFPDVKITHYIADALLIAEYGRKEKEV
jgi:hypothetical protein